jgi:hypothetical protein
MTLFRSVVSAIALAVFSNAPCARAAESVSATGDAPVMMPAFVVSVDRDQPKWRYIGRSGFEVLFLTSDGLAADFATDVAVALDALDKVVPAKARLRLNTPLMFIFDGREPVFLGARGGLRTLYAEGKAPLELRATEGAELRFAALDQDVYVHYLSIGRRSESDLYHLVTDLYRPLLRKSHPRPPAWLTLGTVRVLEFSTKNRSKGWPPEAFWARPRSTLVPLRDVPRVLGRIETGNALTPLEVEEVQTLTDNSTILAKWALFAESGNYRTRYWDFYRRAALSPNEEEWLFQATFGLSYEDAQKRAAESWAETDHGFSSIHLKSKKEVVPVAGGEIRDATPAEIARITGEWARLAAVSLPAQKDRLLSAAGKIFDRGIKESGMRDPRLVAAAGIYRTEMGRDAEARPLLEEAAKAWVARPRAYLELARIRLTVAGAMAGAGGKLSSAQFASVMSLLHEANAQSDQQEQYYELLLSLWENAAGKPTADELSPLAACAKIFTHRSDLTLRSAQLHATLGRMTEARALAETALRFAKDETTRSALTALRRSAASSSAPTKE